MDYLPIISLLFSLIIFGVFRDQVKKYAVFLYLFFLVLEVFLYVNIEAMYKIEVLPIQMGFYMISRGTLATSLFIIVMYIGCLPNNHPLRKRFMPIRAELSIMASILIFVHNLGYGVYYFVELFTHPLQMKSYQLFATIVTILMLIMLIPLFITSFHVVRKRMKAENWKKIQRLAYPYFMLIYLHVMILYIGRLMAGVEASYLGRYYVGIPFYSIIFISYAVLKIRKEMIIKQQPVRANNRLAKKSSSMITE